MKKEQWVDLVGFEGMYQASADGEIRSLNYRNTGKKSVLKQTVNRGYSVVNLTVNGKQKVYRVHRLIAETFLDNPESKKEVDHIDGNRLNNCVANLRWVTSKENSNNPNTACKLGKQMIGVTGSKHQCSKPVVCIETGIEYASAADAFKDTGIAWSNIAACCRGVRRVAGGCHWKYKQENYKKTRWLNIDTGTIFTTIADAAKSIGVNLTSIYNAVKFGYKSGGYRWARI
jgi:hypothetical protein